MSKKNQGKGTSIIPNERIESKIYLFRGKKVMLDRDLAALYGVTTGNFNLAVRRNKERFPDDDFMFQLTKKEYESLRLQTAILKRGQHAKYLPYVFTEPGVAMLSSVLNSKRAIQVNIQIIKTFTRLRQLIATNQEFREKIEQMEKKYDEQFRVVFDIMKKLLVEEEKPKRRIGFGVRED
jgi:phage regulator Rha-like protein